MRLDFRLVVPLCPLSALSGSNINASSILQNTASRFVGEFLKMALSSDGTHVKLTYQDGDETWVLLYHLVRNNLSALI